MRKEKIRLRMTIREKASKQVRVGTRTSIQREKGRGGRVGFKTLG